MAQNQAVIVGGPNGAGKSTFVEEFLRDLPYRCIGADRIAAEIAPDRPEGAAFDAGREFSRQVARAIAQAESVIIETTLSGRSFHKAIRAMKQRGYFVSVQCIFLGSTDSHLVRVSERVRGGGARCAERSCGSTVHEKSAQLLASISAVGRQVGFVL